MADPLGPFARLTLLLKNTVALRGEVVLLFGRKSLPLVGKPGRIVIYPVGGNMNGPANKLAISDEWIVLAAHIWGRTEDHVQQMHDLLYQALVEQAAGRGDEAGFFWKYDPGSITWETKPDTSAQGEEKTVEFSIYRPTPRAGEGHAVVENVRSTVPRDAVTIDISNP